MLVSSAHIFLLIKLQNATKKGGEFMKPLTINVDTSALDEAEEKVSRLLSLLKEVKEIIGSLKVED